jgi:hypothetical protein
MMVLSWTLNRYESPAAHHLIRRLKLDAGAMSVGIRLTLSLPRKGVISILLQSDLNFRHSWQPRLIVSTDAPRNPEKFAARALARSFHPQDKQVYPPPGVPAL